MLECAHCNKRFKYDSERKRHQESHDPHFSCTVCAKKFSFLSALRRHQKQHERKGTVRCNECGGSFRDDTLLKRHIQYAHKGSYSCPECLATFSSEQALRTHSRIHQPESERRFRCQFAACKKAFNFPHHLKHHELTHTNAKQYFCNVCGKGFIQSHHLKNHFKTHHLDNWLFCTIPDCKTKFTTLHALKKHMATHNTHSNVNCTDMKLGSGVSSDSSAVPDMCEKNYTVVAENVKCTTCGQFIPRLQHLSHTMTCTVEAKQFIKCNDLQDALLNKDTELEDHDSSKSTYNDITSSTYAVIAKEELNKTCNNITTGLKVNYATNSHDRERSPCASCKCSDFRTMPSHPFDKNATLQKNIFKFCNMPELEYRNDGVIKIKETFDADIWIVNKEIVQEGLKDKAEPTDVKHVPYNSCKAVLGTCIVSDDGSIGEGCLCAKMLVDEQVSAQEIDELTPNPHALWI